MVTVKVLRRVPVNGYWLLPGSRAEFATVGQAGFLTITGAAEVVEEVTPMQPKARRKKAKDDTLDADPVERSRSKTADG